MYLKGTHKQSLVVAGKWRALTLWAMVIGNQKSVKGIMVDVVGRCQSGSIFTFKYVEEGVRTSALHAEGPGSVPQVEPRTMPLTCQAQCVGGDAFRDPVLKRKWQHPLVRCGSGGRGIKEGENMWEKESLHCMWWEEILNIAFHGVT
uniref:Uncharacterized protein n=1 Tax=Rousettus aegyptiacus TaxID=9407 RepID=A0A7J8IL77_ROUAE|nr:hypothetical protein HJG63_010586 [Rousettus aegyptiacus]